jgi:hypothetical protein
LFLTVSGGNDEPAPKCFKSSGRHQGAQIISPPLSFFFLFFLAFLKHFLLDTRPASIPSEDDDDDITPPVSKGRLRNGAEPSESGDESSGTALEHISGDEVSSDEDLTTMQREMIQRKLTSEARLLLYSVHSY